VAGSGRIRLFCALQLPEDALDAVAAWQAEHLRRPRVVPRENLHVTLAFLGSRPVDEVPAIAGELRAAAAEAGEVVLRPERYRETRSVGMIACEDVTGAATALAERLGEALERLGAYRREARPWLPHVTVIRFREREGVVLPSPNIRSISVVRSALYRSTPGPGGVRYEELESAALGGR